MDRTPTVILWLYMTTAISLLHVSTGQRGPTNSQIQTASDGDDMSRFQNFTPRPVPPEEVNCHLELQQTVVLGGRCVPLGRGRITWSCQSGIYIHPNSRQCLDLAMQTTTTTTTTRRTRSTRRRPLSAQSP
ncbi:unnamed protein product [Lymnaea stagnalis]|uniref:Sushi domain-containing protein n=1 Tax=Lymnaea stagnalis TaxID=6523 RepID=A0AAV2IMI4_LYMST